MANSMNAIKRPLIFLKDLPEHELTNLISLINFYGIYGHTLPQDLQIFTHKSGSLDTADDLTVDEIDEVVCFTYDDFLTRWSEYKLWLLLQTQ